MPTRTHTTAATAFAAAAAMLVLTGCGSPHEDHLAILAEEPTEPVPEYVYSAAQLEPESARFLAEEDGIEYYIAQQRATPGTVCLIPVNTEDPENGLVAACGGVSDGIIMSMSRSDIDVDVEATLVADEVDDAALEQLAGDGWTEASPNLWIR